jgi:hypothetical protein
MVRVKSFDARSFSARVTKAQWAFVEAIRPVIRAAKVFETIPHKSRLRRHGLRPGDHAPIATVRMRCGCASPLCAAHVSAQCEAIEGYARDAKIWTSMAIFSPVAAILPLANFENAADYVRSVSRVSDGNDRREAARARKKGYSTRRIALRSHSSSLHEIRRSKLVRSGGVVFVAKSPAAGHSARANDIEPTSIEKPACNEHWRVEFGVFNASDPDRMVAHATLARAGNMVDVFEFMGHGATLRDGVTKLLMFDIVEWLLDSGDPLVRGVDYLLYGAIEEATEGRERWKRYLGFKPHAIDIGRVPERNWRPPGFDVAAYLALNPDVKAARVRPLSHFIRKGYHEGRVYAAPGKGPVSESTDIEFSPDLATSAER